jgi:hypothetical protein
VQVNLPSGKQHCTAVGELHVGAAFVPPKPAERNGALDPSAEVVAGTCACRKLNPAILVMQSAQDWATKNVPGAIDGARDRRIFLQG